MREYGKSFTEDVRLDKYDLDNEAMQQPSLMQDYTFQLAEAKSLKGKTEAQLKYTKADAELRIRRKPPMDLKITEAVIVSLVETDEKVKEVQDKLLDASEAVNTLTACVDSLKEKSDMIKHEATLFVAGYWAMPTVKNRKDDSSFM